jgi:hypothetical protein
MEEALVFVRAIQAWIYLILGIAGLVYLRQTLRALGDSRRALFGLERERALARLTRAGAMLVLLLAAAVATLLIVEYVAPAVPVGDLPTAQPTLSLLATPATPQTPDAEGFTTATPLPPVAVDGQGCDNPLATLSAPAPNAELRGTVEIRGTANIDNYAFFRYEYASLPGGTAWRAISAGTARVVDGLLGEWDTSLVTPGEYAFRLVVTDTAGNAPAPCVVRVVIFPSE